MLGLDTAFGRDGVKAFKDALKKAKIVHEEYLPPTTTDFTAGIQRIVDKLKEQPGRKVIEVIWAGGTPPFNALAAQDRTGLVGERARSGRSGGLQQHECRHGTVLLVETG